MSKQMARKRFYVFLFTASGGVMYAANFETVTEAKEYLDGRLQSDGLILEGWS